MKRRYGLVGMVLRVALVATALASCGSNSVTALTSVTALHPVKTCVLQSGNNTIVNGESKFISSFASTPATGAAIVTDGVFSNIYLWPNPNTDTTWDKHLASLSSGAVQSEKSEVLDEITCDLVSSSYFDALTQYGIAPPVFAGEESTLQSCVDSVMANANANGGVIQSGALSDFVNCEQSASGPKTTQVNIIVSPDLKVAEYGKTQDVCATGSSAYHWKLPGTRDYTVIPTGTECNNTISGLTHSLSHEMVETLSDPGGFGWLHESIPGRVLNPPNDLEHQYNEGELGDICSSRGLYPSPPVEFDDPAAGVGTLSVAPYWSNADNTCEPKFIMNQTLVAKTGNPLVAFTGQVHEISETVALPSSVAGQAVQALEIAVTTGSDDLRGGSNLGDNATVVLNLRGAQSFTVNNINESNEWSNGALHTAFLAFPPGISAGDIVSISLKTNFGGGVDGDNWNVNGLTLKAALSAQLGCPMTSVTLVNQQGTATLSDGSIGLVRMSGSTHDFSIPIQFTGSQANQLVTSLQLTVGTGNDDLRGGNSLADNANATIALKFGTPVPFDNINGFGTWTNNSTDSVQLLSLSSLPPDTTVGDITGITLDTQFGGGISGDNWDVTSLVLQAAGGCTFVGPTPALSSITLFTAPPNAVLSDGSRGVIRMTGDVHDWSHSIPVPSGMAGDTLVQLKLTIVTGNDDLRGGNAPSDNADVIVDFGPLGSTRYNNVNQSQTWNNGETHTITLTPLPQSATLGDLANITIETAFTGGINGDNWDIAQVTLVATLAQ
jgi:hypothetical protein